jgi:hypothetical protein
MRLPRNMHDSALPATTLAGLLSIVIATRQRLITLGVHHVPRDPFEHRQKFLLSLRDFKNHYSSSPFLDVSCISQIRHQFENKAKVRKALRSKIEDVLSPTTGHDDVKDEETADIYSLATMVRNGAAPEIMDVQVLWAGQERVKVTRARMRERGAAEDTTDTEPDSKHRGGFMKAIGGRAGRAGKRALQG